MRIEYLGLDLEKYSNEKKILEFLKEAWWPILLVSALLWMFSVPPSKSVKEHLLDQIKHVEEIVKPELKKERLRIDSLRSFKIDSTINYKKDSVFALYSPIDTLFRGSDEQMISHLEALNSLDTIYFKLPRRKSLPLIYAIGGNGMYNPGEEESRMRIIINSDVRLHSSYVRFDSLQWMDWPERPFNLIYFTLLSDESFGREAWRMWNHLHYDSIQ